MCSLLLVKSLAWNINGYHQNLCFICCHGAGRNSRLLFTLSMVKTGQDYLAAGSGGTCACAVCVAFIATPDRYWPGLCRLRRGLYRCRAFVAVGGRWCASKWLGSIRWRGGVNRNGNNHVCAAAGLIEVFVKRGCAGLMPPYGIPGWRIVGAAACLCGS